jgi:solute carrier family 13 (sodium-dependent dicarboxylate transporter), member 2/3/5
VSAPDDQLPGAGFERRMRRVGLVAGPIAAVLAGWASRHGPAPALPGLMALCVIWWLTEALPMAVVALVAAIGTVVTGLAPPRVAFGAFGTPILYLFVGSFFIAEAMKVHGLGERLAATMARGARGRLSFMVAISATAFVLSMLMSNTAATAIVLPIALAAVGGADVDRRYATAMILAVAWGASVGGIATPVGTPPNLIGLRALRHAGADISFPAWVAVGLPLGLIMLAGMCTIVALVFRVRPGHPLPRRDGGRRPWSRGEVSVVIALALATAGWLAPTVAKLAWPDAAGWLRGHLTEEVVALCAGCALFVLPGGSRSAPRPALTWDEAVRIDWGVILLFGGGVLLGDLAGKTGLSADWGRSLIAWTGAGTTWSITALVTAVSIVLSEATSNTATATLMAPLAASLAHAAGAPIIPPVLGATLGSSFGFMMPISTGPNAMAYATGRVRVIDMMRAGITFDVAGFILIVAGLRLICPLLGWT